MSMFLVLLKYTLMRLTRVIYYDYRELRLVLVMNSAVRSDDLLVVDYKIKVTPDNSANKLQ
jgi:hypothetical protein